MTQYYQNNRDHIKARVKAYNAKNKEKIALYQKKYHREYYKANREEILECKMEYYQANREELLKRQKEYYHANKDKARKYYRDNKEKIQSYQKEYHKKSNDSLEDLPP